MMQKYVGPLIVLAVVALAGCGKESSTGPVLDRQIRLPITLQGYGYRDTTWWGSANLDNTLPKFDKRNYQGVDSIIWIASISTSTATVPIRAQLYNLTDSVAIAGSEISTFSTRPVVVQSGNIFAALPDHEITLGYRMRSEGANVYVQLDGALLFMYRR
ncbi:MAG: hypothetical protein JST22_04450 [Bacteroidetes bacterium]|nr:hypothetical protein [Bacteroidota bacterium]